MPMAADRLDMRFAACIAAWFPKHGQDELKRKKDWQQDGNDLM